MKAMGIEEEDPEDRAKREADVESRSKVRDNVAKREEMDRALGLVKATVQAKNGKGQHETKLKRALKDYENQMMDKLGAPRKPLTYAKEYDRSNQQSTP